MKNNRWSNYEIMKTQMADFFLQYNQDEMIGKFSLEHDNLFLYIDFTGRHYRIDRQSGVVMWQSQSLWCQADYNEVMTLYDLLCYSRPNCRASGNMKNLASLSSIRGGSLQKGAGFFQNSARHFAGKTDALSIACRSLGGIPDGISDVGYRLPLFSFLDVILHFWDADEEFPANLQILVDTNILDFMHYETVMFAIGHLLERLRDKSQELPQQ